MTGCVRSPQCAVGTTQQPPPPSASHGAELPRACGSSTAFDDDAAGLSGRGGCCAGRRLGSLAVARRRPAHVAMNHADCGVMLCGRLPAKSLEPPGRFTRSLLGIGLSHTRRLPYGARCGQTQKTHELYVASASVLDMPRVRVSLRVCQVWRVGRRGLYGSVSHSSHLSGGDLPPLMNSCRERQARA
jgi:hypothetical protein